MTTYLAYLSLGSNIPPSPSYLDGAVEGLRSVAVESSMVVSSVFPTAPWGGVDQAPFLNMCVKMETALSPEALLAHCQQLEQNAHRVRTLKWGERTLDVDILHMIVPKTGEEVTSATETLTLPHPFWAQRRFVLDPLLEIEPLFTAQGVKGQEALLKAT